MKFSGKSWVFCAISAALASGCSNNREPAPTADSAPKATTQAASPAPEQPKAAPAKVVLSQLPAIPTTDSPPPTDEEWAAAPFIQNTDSDRPVSDCTMRLLREWLKLRCEGDIKGAEPDSVKWFSEKANTKNWYESHRYPDYAEITFRLRKGTLGEAYFYRKNRENSARYYADWDKSKDRPSTLFLKKWKLLPGAASGRPLRLSGLRPPLFTRRARAPNEQDQGHRILSLRR